MPSVQMTPHHIILPDEIQANFEKRPYHGERVGYKFLKSSHADEAVFKGSIRVGSLREFREHESPLTRDVLEGKDTAVVNFSGNTNLFSPKSFFRSIINVNGENISIDDAGIQNTASDMYVYCFSYECSAAVAASFDYGAVLQITDLYSQAESLIITQPALAGCGYVCAPVQYCSRIRSPHDDNRHTVWSVFEEPKQFARNVEGRLVFVKNNHSTAELQPLYPCHSILRQFFKRYPFPQQT